MSGEEIKANAIIANMIKAALMDAVHEKKLSQFKMAVFMNDGPKFARVIVVPEEMDRKWPVNAPLGSVSPRAGE